MRDLKRLVQKAMVGDGGAFLKIITIFKPYCRSLLRRSNYWIEEQELTLQIIHSIKHLSGKNIDSFNSDGQLFNYIKTGIKNRHIVLIKKQFLIKSREMPFAEEVKQIPEEYGDSFSDFYINDLLKHLTPLQKSVVTKKIFNDMSDVEIAKELCISRQSVNRIKNRAFSTLKENL